MMKGGQHQITAHLLREFSGYPDSQLNKNINEGRGHFSWDSVIMEKNKTIMMGWKPI